MFAPDQFGSFQTILFRQNGYHIDHDQNMHFFYTINDDVFVLVGSIQFCFEYGSNAYKLSVNFD